MEKNTKQLSFSCHTVAKRKLKNEFFTQMNSLIDWSLVEKEIRLYYNKGFSATGRASYSGLLLFKMSLLQTWYGLSDYEVEERVNDSLSFMLFVGLTLEDAVPDNTVLSRFRTELTKKDAYEKLLININNQLEAKGILLKKGAIVDASITGTQRKPRGKKTYKMVEDRKEEEDVPTVEPKLKLEVDVKSHVDTEAAWVKKGGKLRYGFKKHTLTDEQGLVRAIITTPANESDMVHLADVVEKAKLEKGSRVRADKGYSSKANRDFLKENKLKDGIMHKAVKNKPLTNHQQRFNKIVSTVRYRVERTFGSIRMWFKSDTARYVGQSKTHTQHLMEGMAYNLYRSPGILVSNSKLIAS